MSITGIHYHLATGKTSKNRAKFYKCLNKANDPVDGCIIHPAYRDIEGKERIFDTRWDLIEEGLFPAYSDLSFEEMKEALDSSCMLGIGRYTRHKLTNNNSKMHKANFYEENIVSNKRDHDSTTISTSIQN